MTIAPRTTLTELESCVLGAIWLRGPCSAYAIRREFADSSSSYWSASAGSIYPVIERLLRLKLVCARPKPSDGRGKRDMAATAKGERVLRSWICELPAWAGKATLDPIRTRMNFLALLDTAKAQRAFVARAQANTRTEIEALKRTMREGPAMSEVARLTVLGSLYELMGRMRWLSAVIEALSRQSPHK